MSGVPNGVPPTLPPTPQPGRYPPRAPGTRLWQPARGPVACLIAVLLYSYWWDASGMAWLRGSGGPDALVIAVSGLILAALVLSAGWLLLCQGRPSLLAATIFVVAGGILVLAGPLADAGVTLPLFGDFGLYAALATGEFLRIAAAFVVVQGVAGILQRATRRPI